MKKLIVTLLLTATTFNVYAGDWVVPLVGGMILGSAITRSQQPVYAPPVIMGPPPVIVGQAPIYSPGLFREYYNCLVPIRDPLTGIIRNEVMTCTR